MNAEHDDDDTAWVDIFSADDPLSVKLAGLRAFYVADLRRQIIDTLAVEGVLVPGKVIDAKLSDALARLGDRLEARVAADLARLCGPQALN